MSRFKTKKLPKHPLSRSHGISSSGTISCFSQKPLTSKRLPKSSTTNSSRIIRKITSILLIISGMLFLGQLALNAIGQTHISINQEHHTFQSISTGTSEKKEPESKNILIAGIGGKGHPGGELTDSLMFAHLDPKNQEITLLSIPRDIYVSYDNKTRATKINALYPIGQSYGTGINLLAEKIAEITGQPVDHYVVIDFSGFKQIVDALGGISVDVPQNIYDNEYPNNNYGYEIFALKKGLQTLDGATALKFARSRHSTSDFDRSSRQRLLITAIKDKALSLGILTNPSKIKELIHSVRSNISTDLTVGDVVHLALTFKDIDNKNIKMYGLNNACNGAHCLPGSYLYQPSKEYFGGAWSLIPEGASLSRLSTYGAINEFVNIILQYPNLIDAPKAISIITPKKHVAQARLIRKHLMQIGFPVDYNHIIVQTGAITGNTRITSYWNEMETTSGEKKSIGYNEEHVIIQALKELDSSIPISTAPNNEFIRDQGPRIEIILGDDLKEYFPSIKAAKYLPVKQPPSPSTISTQTGTTSVDSADTGTQRDIQTGSTSKNTPPSEPPLELSLSQDAFNTPLPPPPLLPSEVPPNKTESYKFQAGEWEQF